MTAKADAANEFAGEQRSNPSRWSSKLEKFV